MSSSTYTHIAEVQTGEVHFWQSLPIIEGNSGLHVEGSVGPELNAHGLRTIFKAVPNRRALRRQFKRLVKASHHGARPAIQLDAHGNDDGLRLASGETIYWRQLRSWCREVNVASANNLVLVLAACNGKPILSEMEHWMPAPFCFCFSADGTVTDGTLRHELPGLYRRLVRKGTIGDFRPAGLAPFSAEQELVLLAGKLLKAHLVGSGRRQLTERLVSAGMSAPNAETLGLPAVRVLAKQFREEHPRRWLAAMWRVFLLSDHPDNSGRFYLPYDELLELARTQ